MFAVAVDFVSRQCVAGVVENESYGRITKAPRTPSAFVALAASVSD